MILSARQVTRTFGRNANAFTALKGVNLQIDKGQSLAIVGKSGSGKSTLMHLLAVLDRPTSGSISLDGTDLSDRTPAELDRIRSRRFGFVFQQFFLNPKQSALENVILPLKVQGVRRAERRRRGLDVLAEVDLTDKAVTPADVLSGGQKQRVCIARAIITKPDIIFADEPTGNLDTATGQRVIDRLFQLSRERGITLVIVTHDSELARRCDRRVHLHDGTISEPAK